MAYVGVRNSCHDGPGFIAIDISTTLPATKFTRRIESPVDKIHNAPRTDGLGRLFVPGEMEWECLERARSGGIALPSDVVESLRDLAEMAGVNLENHF